MTTFYGLLVMGILVTIGLHRMANAIDGLTQVLKEDN